MTGTRYPPFIPVLCLKVAHFTNSNTKRLTCIPCIMQVLAFDMNIGSSISRVACDRAVLTSHIWLSQGGEYEDMALSVSNQTSLIEALPVPGTSIILPPPQFHNWHQHQICFIAWLPLPD